MQPADSGAYTAQADSGATSKKGRPQDPLTQRAQKKLFHQNWSKDNERTPAAHRVFQYTMMTFVPFLVYVLVLFVTAYLFYRSPFVVFMTYGTVATLCLLQYLVIAHCLKRASMVKNGWKKWVGFIAFFAATAALMLGLLIHYKWMLFFNKYTNMMTYTNVAASQPAQQFEDAGSLVFTTGTSIDSTRAVGYRDIRNSQTLCVAPVVDQQMAVTDPIEFFAVGVGCCGWRASFLCDDAKQPGTRGSLLVLEPDKLVSPAMEWMVDEQFPFEGFQKAIDLQKSVFAVTASVNHRLVRWVKDPSAAIDIYRKRGLEACLFSCLLFFLVAACFISRDVAVEELKQRQAVDLYTKGKASA